MAPSTEFSSKQGASTSCRFVPVDDADLLRVATDDARSLLAAAELGWERQVRHCPEWNAAALVRHTGEVFNWIGAIVESKQRVKRPAQRSAAEKPLDLSAWYLTNLERALEILGAAEPQSASWTFSSTGDQRVGWWFRRLAVEVAIHRWDAEDTAASHGSSPPRPLDGRVAAAGVEEFIVEFLPGLLSQPTVDGFAGRLLLHALDESREWLIDLDAGGEALSESLGADTIVRGTNSEILLWLTNRCSWDRLDVSGPTIVLDHWVRLQR